ncbi:MAG: HAD family phosphatase [Clostridia bacterium]|nr:HAD family phosphatase [Clostridia bacterium]
MKIFDKDIYGVIFDLDGTLLDSSWVWLKVDADFLAENGIQVTDDYTDAVHQMHFNEAALYTKTRYNLSQSVEQIKDRWIEMVQYEYARNIKLKESAYDFIIKLIKSGVKVAFATTLFKKVAVPCLLNNKLTKEFLGVDCPLTTADEVERGKDFPDIYLLAASKIGVEPRSCMVFEDIPLAMRGAQKGGFEFCGVYDLSSNGNTNFADMCRYYIKNFQELL